MAGQYDLGTARGKVVVDYESKNAKRVQDEIKSVQSTLAKSGTNQWASAAAGLGVGIPQLQKYIEVQKAVSDATRTAAFFEANLNAARRRSGAGSLEAIRAEMMAVKARQSLVDITKTLQVVQGNLPNAMAGQGSLLAASLAGGYKTTLTKELGGGAGSSFLQGLLRGALVGVARGAVFAGLAAAATAAGSAVAAAGYVAFKGWQRVTAIDEAEAKMRALGKSADEVKSIMASANEAVLKTSFGLADAATVAAQAIGAGIPPGKQLTKYLKEVADAAAITSVPLTQMGDIFTRIVAGNRAYTEDLMMISRQGIPIWKELAKEYGVTEAKLRQMVENGQVDAKTFRKVLAEDISGAAVAMGNTIQGSINNLNAALSRIGGNALAPLRTAIPGIINGLIKKLDELNSWLVTHQGDVAEFFANIGKFGVGALRLLNNFLAQTLTDLSDFAGMLSGTLKAIEAVYRLGSKVGLGGQKEADDIRKIIDSLEGFSRGSDKSAASLEKNNVAFDQWLASLEKWRQQYKNGVPVPPTEPIDKTTEAVVSLQEQLEKLNITEDAVNSAVQGTDEEFRKFLKTLKDKRAPDAFINAIIQMRNVFNQAGPGARDLSRAIALLGDKTVDANTKAQALIKSLKEIGLLPNDDALAGFNQTLNDLTDYTKVGTDSLSVFGDALVNTDKTINTTSSNGQTLWKKLSDAQKAAFDAASAEGSDPAKIWQETHDALLLVLSDFRITGQTAEDIINNYLLPKHNFEVQFTQRGGDSLRAELTTIFDQIDAAKKNGQDKVDFRVDVTGDKEELKKQVEALGGSVIFDPLGIGATVHLPPSAQLDSQRARLEQEWKQNTQPMDLPATVTVPNQSDKIAEDATGGQPVPLPGTMDVPTDPAGIAEQATGGAPVQIPGEIVLNKPPVPINPDQKPTDAYGGGGSWGNDKQFPGGVGGGGSWGDENQYQPGPIPDWIPIIGAWDDIIKQWNERKRQEAAAAAATPSPGGAGQGYFDTQAASKALDLATASVAGDNLASTAQQQGQNFAEAFAQGILDSLQKVNDAALELAKKASEPLGQSPAPYGPLSGSGWTFNRGQNFSHAFAAGIVSGTGTVNRASLNLAGGATDGLQDSIGIFLKDYGEFSDFMKHAFDFITSLGDIAFNVLAFANTVSGGRLFPKTYVNDPAKAAERQKRIDRENKRKEIAAQTASQPTPDVPHLGQQKPPGPVQPLGEDAYAKSKPTPGATQANPPATPKGKLPPTFRTLLKPPGGGSNSKQDIANYIINKAMSLGYSRKQANDFVVQAVGESGLDPTAFGKNTGDASGGAAGIFQFTPGTWGNRPGSINNAKDNIDAYFELARQRGLTPENFTKGTQLGTQVSIGGPWHPENISKGHLSRAQALAQQYIDGYQGNVTPANMRSLLPSLPGRSLTYSKQMIRQLGIPQLYTPGEYGYSRGGGGLPQWAYDLGNKFNLQTSSSVSASGIDSTHGAGNAFDWSGDPKDMERMAAWLASTPAVKSQLLQLIHQGQITGNNYEIAGGQNAPGYYGAGTMGQHRDHIHGALAAPVSADGTVLQTAMRPVPVELSSNITRSLENIDNNTANPTGDLGLPPLIEEMARNDELLRQAVTATRQGEIDQGTAGPLLQHLDDLIYQQTQINTPQSKDTASYLGGIRTNLMNTAGVMEGPDILSQVQNIAQGAVGIAQDVFGIIDSSIQSVSAANDIANVAARGIANSEDVFKIVDNIQTFLTLAQRIWGAVGDAFSFAGGIVGGAGMAAGGSDMGATQAAAMALGAAGSVSQIVASVISAWNAGIDLAQEAYRIATKYMARNLLNWVGLPGASDLKYLLDEYSGQLQLYTSDNPDNKSIFNTLAREIQGTNAYPGRTNSTSNTFHIYQGPGQDPRDTMNNAMFAIKSSGVGVFGYE